VFIGFWDQGGGFFFFGGVVVAVDSVGWVGGIGGAHGWILMGLWCRRWLGFWICNSGGLMMMFVANNKKRNESVERDPES
jgi:hypothetical protein